MEEIDQNMRQMISFYLHKMIDKAYINLICLA